MNAIDPLLEHCRSLPGATEDVKWGDNLVFSVGGKMFAGFGLPDCRQLGMKVDEDLFPALVQREGIAPSKYMARFHWIDIHDRSQVPEEMLLDLLADAHRLVAAKLSRKKRRELGLE